MYHVGGNLAIHYEFTKVELATEAGLKFAKVYFVNCNLAIDLPNFSAFVKTRTGLDRTGPKVNSSRKLLNTRN